MSGGGILHIGQVTELCSQCTRYRTYTAQNIMTRLIPAIHHGKAFIVRSTDGPFFEAMVTWAFIHPDDLQLFLDGQQPINGDFRPDDGVGVVCNLIAPYGNGAQVARLFQRYLAKRYGEGRIFHWRRAWKTGKHGFAVSRDNGYELAA